MNITHMIRVLLDDGRCQKHYVEKEAPDWFDFTASLAGEWVGWLIEDSFYSKDKVAGIQIEPFKGFAVNANGYEVICDDPNDLFLPVQAQLAARVQEAKALQAYLEKLLQQGDVGVRSTVQHAEVCESPGDARPEGVDTQDARPNC